MSEFFFDDFKDYVNGDEFASRRRRPPISPGKVTLTSRISRVARASITQPAKPVSPPAAPVQRKAETHSYRTSEVDKADWDLAFRPDLQSVQAKGAVDAEESDHVHSAAIAGVSGSGGTLPHIERIQSSFGPDHELGQIRAHVGSAATAATLAISASAYATGNQVAFRSAPDLHTAAHEAAHIVQQQQGVHLRDGVGRVGDVYERHADAVADRVVAGQSAADLLAAGPTGHSTAGTRRVEPAARAAPTGIKRHQHSETSKQEATRITASGALHSPQIQRQPALHDHKDDSIKGPDTALPDGGTAVNEPGKVMWDGSPALRLRSSPTTEGDNIVSNLAFNTTVQIIKRFQGGWVYIAEKGGKTGYCAESYLWFAPEHPLPEPNADLHRVQSGEKGHAINIAREKFGFAADDWGQDLRFYVNVLGKLNGLDVPDSVSGWKTVGFKAGEFIWIPSQSFASGMKGLVNSGSYIYETADALGIADGIERVGELMEDFRKAVALSAAYLPEALARHVTESFIDILKSLMWLALGAVGIMAISTAIGAGVGALAGGAGAAPGAAAGFKVGLAICEWLGLGLLLVWIAQSAAAIGTAFATFIATVWNARGNPDVLDRAAQEHAEAWGTVAGVLVEALVMYAAAKGIPALLGMLRGTRFGEAIGESKLSEWLNERLAEYQQGDSKLPGPRETLLRTRAKKLAKELAAPEDAVVSLLRLFKPEAVRKLHEVLGSEGLVKLSSKELPVLDALQRAWDTAGSDSVARAEIAESLRLNAEKGSLSNQALIDSFNAYINFKSKYGSKVTGDFISRFRRLFSGDKTHADAAAELKLAEDLLAGNTRLGEVGRVEGLAESKVEGVQTPEYRATTAEGAKLVECKAIGSENASFGKNTIHGNLRKAKQQIDVQSQATGERGGLIRLDASKAKATDVSPDTLVRWVNDKIPRPKDSTVIEYVEILYANGKGEAVKVTLRLDKGRFIIDTIGDW